jgi:hypothetical protein
LKSSPYSEISGTLKRTPKAHTGAGKGTADFLCLLCFRHGASQPRQASPERVGYYRQTQLFYRGLWKSVKRNGLRFLLRNRCAILWFPAAYAKIPPNCPGGTQ